MGRKPIAGRSAAIPRPGAAETGFCYQHVKVQSETIEMTDEQSLKDAIKILNDPAIQQKILAASKEAAWNELQSVPGFTLSVEELAKLIATTIAEPGPRDPAETLAAGAVFVATAAVIFSDIRLKQDIMFKDVSEMGINVYEFSYLGSQARWRGALAQEVQAVMPEAVVTHPTGLLMVDYSKIDVAFVPA
jgi:hypothetical protein